MSSHLKGPSNGDWSVFAEKVVEERDLLAVALAAERERAEGNSRLNHDLLVERDAARSALAEAERQLANMTKCNNAHAATSVATRADLAELKDACADQQGIIKRLLRNEQKLTAHVKTLEGMVRECLEPAPLTVSGLDALRRRLRAALAGGG